MKYRILVIDDNVSLTALLSKTLTKYGYSIFVENDSSFALDTVRRVRPSLIILDIMMPHRDGGQVLHDLRSDVQLRQTPVVILTGMAREAKTLARQGGIESQILSKPIELKSLLEVIEKHVVELPTSLQTRNQELPHHQLADTKRETLLAEVPTHPQHAGAPFGFQPPSNRKANPFGEAPTAQRDKPVSMNFQSLNGNPEKVDLPR